MRRFASLDPFIDTTDWNFRMGRPIANEGFLRALLNYGTFDEYRFYLPDQASIQTWTSNVEKLASDAKLRVVAAPMLALAADLRDLRYDVFHQGDFTHFNPQLSLIRNHHAAHPFPITGVTHSLDQPAMQQRFLQIALSDAAPYDAIVCTSDAAVCLVQNKFAEIGRLLHDAGATVPPIPIRTARIPLGVDDDAFGPAPGSPAHRTARRAAREQFGISEETTVFLSVGRLSLRTKVDWAPILERLAELRARGEFQRSILVIAGGGGDGQLIQSLIADLRLDDCVVLFPNFAPETKASLFALADVYLSLVDNYQETFGINIIEALAAGLPVIASDFDGYRDAIRGGLNGWLIPTIASVDLPPAIDTLYGVLDPSMARFYAAQMVAVDLDAFEGALRASVDPSTRRRLADAARRTAERYRWSRIIAEYEALWTDLSAIAASAPPRPKQTRPALLGGDGVRAFAHYPASLLRPDDYVEITDKGRAMLVDPLATQHYQDLEPAMPRHSATTLLHALRDGPQRAADLTDRTGVDALTLMWAYKHGGLRRSHRKL